MNGIIAIIGVLVAATFLIKLFNMAIAGRKQPVEKKEDGPTTIESAPRPLAPRGSGGVTRQYIQSRSQQRRESVQRKTPVVVPVPIPVSESAPISSPSYSSSDNDSSSSSSSSSDSSSDSGFSFGGGGDFGGGGGGSDW